MLISLLLLGFFLRVHDLTGTPPGLDGDEMFYYFDSNRILQGEFKVYYPTNYGHEPLFMYAEAAMLSTLGRHAFTLRYTAVLGGMLMLAGAYVLARRLFNRTTALITLGLFAALVWPVFMTRVGLRAFTFPLLTIYSVYALWRALHERSWRWTIAAGVFNGLTLYTYVSSRVFPAVILLWLIGLLLFDRQWLMGNGRRVLAILALAIVIIYPFADFAFRNPDVVNQRLYTMGGPFYEVQRGEFRGLFENIGQVLGMFTFVGDHEVRYNIDARPIFDPLTGAFFYVGGIVALSRVRRPAYYLLWLWFGVTLAPTLLAIGAPSFLRASGALFPTLVLSALGADWLIKRWPRWTTGLGFLIGVVGVTAWTVYGFFIGPWRTSPELMRVYESDIYLTSRYIADNHLSPDDNLILIVGAAADSSPTLFNLEAPRPTAAQFTYSFVWPARQAQTWYFFNQEALPDSLTQSWLPIPPLDTLTDNAGNPLLEIYRLPAPPIPPQPAVPVQAYFDHLVDLLGITYLTPLLRGQPAEALIFWRVRPGFSLDVTDMPIYHFGLHSGNIEWVNVSGLLAFPPTSWRAGDVWVQRIGFTPPADMPPQSLQPDISLTTHQGAWPVIPEGADRARTFFSLPPVTVAGQPVAAAPPSTAAPHFGGLTLINVISFSATTEPGLPVYFKTTWQAGQAVAENYALQFQGLDLAGDETFSVTQTLLQNVYPTHHWRIGEQISSNDPVYLPVITPSGDYRLRLRLVNAQQQPLGDWVELGNLQVRGRPHLLTQPAVDVTLTTQFGEVARLVGYRLNLTNAHPGGEIKLTVIWQALSRSATPLRVFAHLYTLADTFNVLAQHDGPPAGGTVLTSTWLEGEFIEDEHRLPLDSTLTPGDYRLGVGLYDPDTLQRLPVTLGESANDAVLLTTLTLASP